MAGGGGRQRGKRFCSCHHTCNLVPFPCDSITAGVAEQQQAAQAASSSAPLLEAVEHLPLPHDLAPLLHQCLCRLLLPLHCGEQK